MARPDWNDVAETGLGGVVALQQAIDEDLEIGLPLDREDGRTDNTTGFAPYNIKGERGRVDGGATLFG